jgi:long-chain acyl-CoA synthetase
MACETIHIDPETAPKLAAARSITGSADEAPLLELPCIGHLLMERAERLPNSPWLAFAEDGRITGRWDTAEFTAEVLRAAGAMQGRLGLQAGDRIAALMGNDPTTVLIYFAAWLLGAVVVPVNTGEDDERVAYILQNCAARAAFALSPQVSRLQGMLKDLPELRHAVAVGADAPTGFHRFDDILAETVPIETIPVLPTSSEALIVYTSGTTGAPKGVSLDQYNLLIDAHCIADWHRLTAEDRAMCVLPIHHVNGIIVTLVTPMLSGGSVVLHRKFSAGSFWKTLASERCTWTSVVPTILAFLCEAGEDISALDLQSFRHLICGAGPLTVETARRFHHQFGRRVVHGYGLSETTCYSCFLPIDLEEGAFEHWMFGCGYPAIGCPLPCNQMAIHNSEGAALGPDERGEIVIRGQNVMRWYFGRPEANRDTFAHGWFRSGDEGFYRMDGQGRMVFFITGRLKELIIRGGVNYSPFEIDEVLNAVPGVKAAMAVGFENDFYGEEVGAYVVAEPGSRLTEEEILAACAEKLPFAKRPKVVVFGTDFPVTSTGKYQRNRLKPLFAAWRGAQFRPESPR